MSFRSGMGIAQEDIFDQAVVARQHSIGKQRIRLALERQVQPFPFWRGNQAHRDRIEKTFLHFHVEAFSGDELASNFAESKDGILLVEIEKVGGLRKGSEAIRKFPMILDDMKNVRGVSR